MAKIPMHTRDEVLLSNSIRKVLDDESLAYPLGTSSLFMAMERLHFPTYLYFNKLFGMWCFSNLPENMWPLDFKDSFAGANFTFFDVTAEMAAARGIHYYYHLKIKE